MRKGIALRKWMVIGLVVLMALLGTLIALSIQSPAIRAIDEAILREYAGVYQWDRNSFLYLQIWPELTGTNQLVAFDETGELRTLYPTEPDRFFTGPGAALPAPVESRIEVQRADSGTIPSLTWSREDAPTRTAGRVDIERREDVRFSNGNVQLAGTLISPTISGQIVERRLVPVARRAPKSPTDVITITRDGDSLWARISGLDYQLFAEGRQEFFIRAVDAQLAFDVDGSGNTTGLTLHYGGRTFTAQKRP